MDLNTTSITHDSTPSPTISFPLSNMGNTLVKLSGTLPNTTSQSGPHLLPNPGFSITSCRDDPLSVANSEHSNGDKPLQLSSSSSQPGGFPTNGGAKLHSTCFLGTNSNSVSSCYKWDSTKDRINSKFRRLEKYSSSNERDSVRNNNLKRNKGLTLQRKIHKKCILICPPNPRKTSLDIRALVNQEIGNFVVILNPIMIEENQMTGN